MKTHPPQEQRENVNTPDFGTKLESIKHIGDMVDGEMVCREDCPSITHRNTPDTEVEAEDDGLSDFVSRIRNAVNYKGSDDHEDVRSILKDLLTSRDTYWKERVEEIREKTRNEVLSRILLIISAKALNETWNAERQLERVENFCKNPSWGIAETGNMMLTTK